MCKLINRNWDQTERHGTFLKERKFDDRHRFTLNLSDIDASSVSIVNSEHEIAGWVI